MTERRSGPREGRSNVEVATSTDKDSVGEASDNSPDENVVPFRSLGWLEYQEARRQLREYNAKRRARRGGGR
jgi:hypothetical protein